jgi:hypothetical protein
MPENWDEAPPINENYSVAAGDVLLDVVVGNGQLGSIGVRLDGAKTGSGTQKLHVNLGAGAAIRGKKALIIAVVHDVNPMTNRTIVTYSLAGGANPATYTSTFDATKDFGVVIHTATISFV